ncbi:archease [Candidatus Woesearchaeota archaeon]|nr:archease [Candidatus Woesearchaeota archaeon]
MERPFHKFLDHTADVFFVAKADTLSELFEQCALAVEETMVDITKVVPQQKVKILGEDKNIETLLYDFLDELVFFKDYKQMMFGRFEVSIEEKDGKYFLTCLAFGEKLDLARHDPKVDVKAITMHEFEVKKIDKGWQANVIVDI